MFFLCIKHPKYPIILCLYLILSLPVPRDIEEGVRTLYSPWTYLQILWSFVILVWDVQMKIHKSYPNKLVDRNDPSSELSPRSSISYLQISSICPLIMCLTYATAITTLNVKKKDPSPGRWAKCSILYSSAKGFSTMESFSTQQPNLCPICCLVSVNGQPLPSPEAWAAWSQMWFSLM